MLPLAGYTDRLSVRPGETIAFKVSCSSPTAVIAKLVRIVSADPNPAGPGIKEEAVPADFAGFYTASALPVVRGSYAQVEIGGRLASLQSLSVLATVLPTKLSEREATVITGGTESGDGFRLVIDNQSRVQGVLDTSDGALAAATVRAPLPEGAWHRLWLTLNAERGVLDVGAVPLVQGGASGTPQSESIVLARSLPLSLTHIVIGGATPGRASAPFNGRIERPMLFDRVLTPDEIAAAALGDSVPGLVAGWDFSQAIESDRIMDIGPYGLHGRLVNTPTRAVAGSRWTGQEMCWRHAPEHYAAIHFHDDDIDDCRWPTLFSWTVPDGARSGAYAVKLDGDSAYENIPFFILPPRGKAAADVAVLIPTFTYVIYANHARPDYSQTPGWAERWHARAEGWCAYPHNPAAHPEYGHSTYNYHSDGSGISISTWHRPMLNVRAGYVTYPDARHGSGLRHFPADTHLLAWLEHKGYAYDVLTDWELHQEGADLLNNYRVVLTGSHPEYCTSEMLDALQSYRDGGGRLCYLGGNGFYWRVALAAHKPGLIEIRRGEGGLRAWAAEPGEYYNQFDGAYGGLWRRNGRPPQKLVGIGFTAQGQFVGSYYRKRPEAADPRVAWMFAGIAGELLGDFGLSGGGAAGFELDRADIRLGTPRHALVVARSERHAKEDWILTHEEQLTHVTTLPGGPPERHIHADMVFFETPNDGAVFSVGSITFCGALPWNGFDNPISQLLQNVLDRFRDPAAQFAMP